MDIKTLADVHCHTLQEVDDGAQTLEEACGMLRMAYEEGIRIIVLTPHHHPRRGRTGLKELKRQVRRLRERIPEIGEDLRLFLGMEVFFGEDILEELDNGEIKPMGKSEYILLEFSPSDEFSYIRSAVQKVQMKGYQVVLAHVERYQCMLEELAYTEELLDMGTYIQVNSGSIIGDSGRTVKKFTKELLKNHYVHFVGTDAHSMERRRPKMKEAASYVQKHYGAEYAERIFFKNAVMMLKNKKIPI